MHQLDYSSRVSHTSKALFLSALMIFSHGCSASDNSEDTPQLQRSTEAPNVFYYIEGNKSIAAVTLAAELSQTKGRLVVLTATTENYEQQAVDHGKKLAAWFADRIDNTDTVPVVVYLNDKGVGYSYLINGFRYTNEEDIKSGIMNPQQSVTALEDALLDHQASLIVEAAGKRPTISKIETISLLDYQIANTEARIKLMEAMAADRRKQATEAFQRAKEAEELLRQIQE